MNKNGNPRLLQYWRDRYRRRRDAFVKLGLTAHGTPRINRKNTLTDPLVRDVVNRQEQMQRYHRRADKYVATGLTTHGKARKRNYPRHIHPDFINPFETAFSQRQQAEYRRNHRHALSLEHSRRHRQKNTALGLTTKGQPRKRNRISSTELAYHQFRAGLTITRPIDVADCSAHTTRERFA